MEFKGEIWVFWFAKTGTWIRKLLNKFLDDEVTTNIIDLRQGYLYNQCFKTYITWEEERSSFVCR